jgi:hypothetical protein
MRVSMVKFLVLAGVVLGSASCIVFLSACPVDTDEPVASLVSQTKELDFQEVVALRSTAREQIAREVIAGRLSLVQAAALFGALNRIPPQSPNLSVVDMHASRLRIRARTDNERLCRQVVECVGSELATEPDREQAAVARLQAEFKEELRKTGTIRLPDPLTVMPVEQLLEQARAELIHKGVLAPKGATGGDRSGTSRS